MSEVAFADLILAARRADRAAQDELARRTRRRLEPFARWVDAKFSLHEASDLLQEAVAATHFHLDRFQGQTEEEWQAWARVVLYNEARDELKRRQAAKRDRHAERALPESSSGGLQVPAPTTSPSQKAIRAEDLALLHANLQKLDFLDREILRLYRLDNLPGDEVAQILGISHDVVRTRAARAVKRLAELMEGKA